MRFAMIGLGRMGANMSRRITRAGHECVAFDQDVKKAHEMAGAEGADKKGKILAAESLADVVKQLGTSPRVIWLMLPAGDITEAAVTELSGLLGKGDIVIDGGNSYFKDDIRRGQMLAKKGIMYMDVGTSGGVWGLERGYCLMIGGDKAAYQVTEPLFKALAPGEGTIDKTRGREGKQTTAEQGFLHCGSIGSGHFVKMIHNGIEYGLMQAYSEGFDILKNAGNEGVAPDHRLNLNMGEIAEVWRRGSVVSSWLLDLISIGLTEDPTLKGFSGEVADSGEGRWTLLAAIEEAVPVNVLSAALYTRFRSRQGNTFAEKLLSSMRYQFGGHVEKKV